MARMTAAEAAVLGVGALHHAPRRGEQLRDARRRARHAARAFAQRGQHLARGLVHLVALLVPRAMEAFEQTRRKYRNALRALAK